MQQGSVGGATEWMVHCGDMFQLLSSCFNNTMSGRQRLEAALTGSFLVGLPHCLLCCLWARLEMHLINDEPNPRHGIHRDDGDDAVIERFTTAGFIVDNMEAGGVYTRIY